MLEQLLKAPGFIYEIGGKHYFLGKWICKECTETDATDCVMMYAMNHDSGELDETMFYFQKIRAYSDFALEVPFNAAKVRTDMEALLIALSDAQTARLEKQFAAFQEDLARL